MIAMRILCAGLAAAVLISPTFAENAPPKGVKKVTSIEGFTEYKLDNGFRILLYPDDSKPVVTVNNIIFVGSRHEGYGEAGMAHLLEHMLFKGTPTHKDIPKLLNARGASFNGTTWVDRTNYYETLKASDDNLEFAIRLEADRMVNSFVRASDLKSEMTVVRNEFERGENSPASILDQRMMAAAFEWHNYGKSTIGNRADIERVPIKNLKAFYKKYYRPDNAMMIIAGKFKPEKALELCATYFGPLKNPKTKLPKTYTEEPVQDGERFATLKRVGEVPLVGLVYHIPAGSHPDFVAIDALETIMTRQPAGRLYKALVETKLCSRVRGSAFAWHDPGVLQFIATVNKEVNPNQVRDSMLDALADVAKKGVSDDEVKRAKTRLLKQIELAQNNTTRLAVLMTEFAASGDWRLFFIYRDRLEKVTAEDVQRVAKTYLKESNRTVGFFLPTKKPTRSAIPQVANVAEMIGDYKGRKKVAAGEAFDPTPENIEKRTTRTTLKSGVKAAFLPKKSRGEMVSFRLVLRFGNADNLQNMAKPAQYLGTLMQRGTKNLSRQQIQEKLDELRARLSVSSNPGSLSATITCKAKNLKAVLAILKQILREPTLPDSELQIIKRSEATSLQQQLNDPLALARTAVVRTINPHKPADPRYIPTIKEDIALVNKTNRAAIKKLYDDYLGGTHGELAVVGNFDMKEVKAAVEDMLAGWDAKEQYARIPRKAFTEIKGGFEKINTPDKKNATYFGAMLIPIRDDDEEYPAIVIGDYILGGGILSSRLANRIRQKDGLSYGVGSNFQASSKDKRASLVIYAICNPKNIDKVHAAAAEELNKLLTDGMTEDELKRARKGYLDQQKVSRSDDGRLASILQSTLYSGRTMEYYAKRDATIGNLTAPSVHAALKRWINPKRIVFRAGGDFGEK